MLPGLHHEPESLRRDDVRSLVSEDQRDPGEVSSDDGHGVRAHSAVGRLLLKLRETGDLVHDLGVLVGFGADAVQLSERLVDCDIDGGGFGGDPEALHCAAFR